MKEQAADTRQEVSRTIRIVRVLGRQLYRSELPRMAAALAYRTLFSMIPVLVLSVVLLGAFATPERVEEAVDRFLGFTGLSEIVIAPATPAEPDGSEAARAEEPSAPSEDAPDGAAEPETVQGQRLDDWIESLVLRVQDLPFRALGFVGLVLLVYAALSMFVEIERSFNQITHSPRGRSWARRVPMYWTTITLGAVFLLASFYVGDQFKHIVGTLLAEGGGFGTIVLGVVGYLVTVCISALLLMILYTTIPATRVGVRAALAGALVAAVAWEAGKWGFTRYLEFSTGYVTVYGSLALLLLFLLWVYVTWIIVLFGLQVAVALHGYERFEREQELREDAGRAHEDPIAVLRVAVVAAIRFEQGRSPSIAELADACGQQPVTAQRITDALVASGVLCRVDDDEGDRVSLARPAHRTPLDEVLRSAVPEEPPEDPTGGAIRRWSEQLRSAQLEAAQGATLADAAGLDPQDRAPAEPGSAAAGTPA
ncbi:MAG: YihY/virulence factor BrkB family protein [Planctomycetota bacterium]